MSDGDLPIPQLLEETISTEWGRLSSAGTWWRGEERLAIARAAPVRENLRRTASCPMSRCGPFDKSQPKLTR